MDGIFLLLGSNMGDRHGQLERAKEQIAKEAGKVIDTSSIYETAAWGKEQQAAFLNQVLHIDSVWSPDQLLKIVLGIEEEMGRIRSEKWGARVIDIDLLYYHSLIITRPELQVPHPGIPKRRFTLAPLAEIAPNFIHPQLRSNQKTLLDNCTDPLEVQVFDKDTER